MHNIGNIMKSNCGNILRELMALSKKKKNEVAACSHENVPADQPINN